MPHALIVGADPALLESLRSTGAQASSVPSAQAALDHCRAGEPVDLVVGDAAVLRPLLDPLGTGAGPAIAEPGTPREIALELELAGARRHAAEADAALAFIGREHARSAQAAERELLARLSAAAAYRDDNTDEHNGRVGRTAARLARALGEERAFAEQLGLAAPLHDLGKIAIPDAILLKPGRLAPEEFAVVKTHAAIGARILAGSSSPVVALAAEVARSHHERWDGSGYPDGLAGEAIPLSGRIVAVADTYDILTHERPWKEEWSAEQALAELERAAGTQFDPRVVQTFTQL
jgi:putative two-component system response regulator